MPRRHHTRRTLLIILSVLAALIGGSTAAAAVALSRDNGPNPFSVAGGVGPVPDGDWHTTSGLAGYRAKERALGVGHDVVGRTVKVTGSAAVVGGELRSGTVSVVLDDFTVSGRHHAESSSLVHADVHPTATFTAHPGAAPGHLDGDLQLNGISRPISWTVATRLASNGTVTLTGTTRVDITQWEVTPPSVSGLAGIDPQVVLEFETTWSR